MAIFLGLALAVGYLRWTPLVPDLAAQVARANLARRAGAGSWWTGWFGGLSTPSYSIFVPPSMAALGVRATGVLATAAGIVGSARLVRHSQRPRAGVWAFAVSSVADLVDGRITFLVGTALGVWALNAYLARRPTLVLVLSVAAYFSSPLAALFLGMIFVALAVVDHDGRVRASASAAVLLAIAIAMSIWFPGTGTMPFSIASAGFAAASCVGVALVCPQPIIRVVSGLTLAAIPVFLVIPGPVGSNITRFCWIAAVPVAVACGTVPKKLLVAVVVLLSAWPMADSVGQVRSGRDDSALPSYYRPLTAALATAQAAAGPTTIGQRLEVVDPLNHWGSVYLTGNSVALARGWDRQVDHAENPIFYRRNALTADSYRQWLDELAVGWVAVPAAPLDFASVDEAKLIRGGLSYLTLAWSNANWHLYRVKDSAPFLTGADLVSVTDTAVTLSAHGPTTVQLRLRWSPYLTVTDPETHQAVPACLFDAAGWVSLYIPNAAVVSVTSDFTVARRLQSADSDCVKDVTAGP